MTAPTDLSRLTLGTAPDSWGVWFEQDPHQRSPHSNNNNNQGGSVS